MPKRPRKSHRIPVKDELFHDLRNFAIGLDATWEVALRCLLGNIQQTGETPMQAGERTLKDWEETQHPYPEDVPS